MFYINRIDWETLQTKDLAQQGLCLASRYHQCHGKRSCIDCYSVVSISVLMLSGIEWC